MTTHHKLESVRVADDMLEEGVPLRHDPTQGTLKQTGVVLPLLTMLS